MRPVSQNNQFVFNLPSDFIPKSLEDKYMLIIEKEYMPYESVIDYLNSTIKEIVFPGMQMESSQQIIKRGKQVRYKDAQNVMDMFTRELDITFKSVDSHINYFMLIDILVNFALDNSMPFIPQIIIQILDKNGDVVYNVVFKEVLLKSLSETRLSYNVTDFSEKTFTLTFSYNFLDILYCIDDKTPISERSTFDIDIEKVDDRKV